MATNDPRIDEVLIALELIKKKLPNGELEIIKQSILSLGQDQKTIKEDLDYLKKRLFNPDDGVIVRINKNTDTIQRTEELIDGIPDIKNKVEQLEQWHEGVQKALWIIYTAIVGIVVSLIVAAIKSH
jgi:hypothetical protein